MTEQEWPARVVEVRYQCDTEGCKQWQNYMGIVLPMSPPLYKHCCRDGHEQSLSKVYPGNRVVSEWGV
jgi:hypothetical protein